MKSEEEKYAELIISMSTDFLLKRISFDHYANTLNMVNENIQQMHYEDGHRLADEELEDL